MEAKNIQNFNEFAREAREKFSVLPQNKWYSLQLIPLPFLSLIEFRLKYFVKKEIKKPIEKER